MNSLRWRALPILLLLSTAGLAQTAPRLESARQKEQAALEQIEAQHSASLASLHEWFTNSLEAMRQAATQRGDLDAVIGTKTAMEQMDTPLPPAAIAKLPPAIATLRRQFDQAHAAIENKSLEAKRTNLRAWLAVLDSMQKQLTQLNRVDEAVQVKGERASTAEKLEALAAPRQSWEDLDSNQATRDKFFKALGPMSEDLLAYFAMDHTENGGLTWSRRPIAVTASDQVRIKTEGGRTYADFSEVGAFINFEPRLDIGSRFTFAAWVQTPVPHLDAVVWHGAFADTMIVKEQALCYYARNQVVEYGQANAPFRGWIHLAATCDGEMTQVYLDGKPFGEPAQVGLKQLMKFGSTEGRQLQETMMSAGIDEQYLFTRPLTSAEVQHLMEFSRPRP